MKTFFSFLSALICFFCFVITVHAQIITTFAGNGYGGYNGDNIPADSASIGYANSVVTDKKGNVYISQESSRIRKVNTAGIITTFAGIGVNGYSGDSGLATAAEISVPNGMAFDKAGNLFFADGYRIRKIDTAGIITTIAGNGSNTTTGDNGPAILASMNPVSLAFDSHDNLYFTDEQNSNVRKVDTGGIISHVAGLNYACYTGDNAAAWHAGLWFPYGLAINVKDDIFIAEIHGRIRKIDTAGIITTIAGDGTVGYSGDNGSADSAEISASAIAFDKLGDLLFGDGYSNRIRKIDTSGIVTTICGNGTAGYSGDGGLATAAEIGAPGGIATYGVDDIYFVDGGNNVVRKIAPASLVVPTTANESLKITIYPNPTSTGQITVTLTSSLDEQAQLVIRNIIGQEILKTIISANKPIELSIAAPAGIYILTANTATDILTKEIIIGCK